MSGASEQVSLPAEFTLGKGTDNERTYELLSFIEGKEFMIDGHEMVRRAEEMNAHLGREDRQYILDHQEEIPPALKEGIYFIFSAERWPSKPDHVAFLFNNSVRWLCDWGSLAELWSAGDGRLLRRRKSDCAA